MLKKIHHIRKTGGITKADLRDLKILLLASSLNLSFAFEKFFIVIGHQLSDFTWMCVYGGAGVVLTYIAIVDYIHDEIEEEKHETNNLI